jgi:hypothetical protein
MRNIGLTILLVAAFCTLMPGLSWSQKYSGGSGTSGDPYQIATKADLKQLSDSAGDWGNYFIQTADISFSASDFQLGGDFYNSGTGFNSIGNSGTEFTGSYDGNHHIISGLTIVETNYDLGFFGIINSSKTPTVTNLGLVDVDITNLTYQYSGALAGYILSGASITNCYSTGTILSGTGGGGLIGYIEGGSISSCYSSVKVVGKSSNAYYGGLIGYLGASTVSDCYATGSIDSTTSIDVGGFVGFSYNSTITNCYAAGVVAHATTNYGGFVGLVNTVTLTNCFYNSDSTDAGTYGYGIAEPTDSLQTESTFTDRGWDFTSTWQITATNYPTLRALSSFGSPFATATAATSVTETSATLNGSVSPKSDTVAVRFLYGTTSGVYTDSVSAVPDTASGDSTTTVSASVTGLSGGTTYYYVIAGANNAVYFRSNEKTFATISAVWGYDLLYSPSNHTLDSTSSIISTDTSSVTIDAWVKWDGTTTGHTPLIASNGNGATDGYGLYLYTNDHLSILLGAVAWLVSDTSLPVGEWSHIALVRSGGTIVLYKDGHSISFSDPNTSGTAQTPPNPPATPFYVGGETGAAYPDLFPGEIDEVRLSDTARYSGLSYIVPNGPFTTDAHTIALFHFNEGSGSTAGDSSGNGNDLTLVNSPTWTGSDNPNAAPLPVEMAAFSVTSNSLSAELRWQTATEVDNDGWEVERKAIANFGVSIADWVSAGFVKGAGTSTQPLHYSFTDQNLSPGTYDYRLKQMDRSGAFKYSPAMTVEVGMAPRVFTLSQNYPNPFNPATTIDFTLERDGHVSLKVYDVLGREVTTLLDENRKAGEYQQVVFDASRYSSGIYFAVLRSDGKQLLKKMLLLK